MPISWVKTLLELANSRTAIQRLQEVAKQSWFLQLKAIAIRHHHDGDMERAIRAYKILLKAKSDDAGLWSNLGAALRSQRQYQSAVNCYRRALALSPTDVIALGNLANALKDLHRLEESIALHAIVVEKSPNDVRNRMNYACALREAGQFTGALRQLGIARMMQPGDPGIEWERAQNLLSLGDYAEGWKAYEARWHTGDISPGTFPCPRWSGQSIRGKRILLHAEQGYGDTILAARFIPLLKKQGAHVTLQCKAELHRVMAEAGADVLRAPLGRASEGDNESGVRAENPGFDFHCPLMSVMGALDIRLDSIPPPVRVAVPLSAREKFSWLNRESPGSLKVGIVWSGSVTFANNANRAVDIAPFLKLGEIPGVCVYSLQKGSPASALQQTGADCVIGNLAAYCDDFADTAAAISYLDIIVMTDSSVAHLAASMGKPVLNLLQSVPYWLYTLKESTTPWYPGMRLIKQTVPGEWSNVFDRAFSSVEKLAAACSRNKVVST